MKNGASVATLASTSRRTRNTYSFNDRFFLWDTAQTPLSAPCCTVCCCSATPVLSQRQCNQSKPKLQNLRGTVPTSLPDLNVVLPDYTIPEQPNFYERAHPVKLLITWLAAEAVFFRTRNGDSEATIESSSGNVW